MFNKPASVLKKLGTKTFFSLCVYLLLVLKEKFYFLKELIVNLWELHSLCFLNEVMFLSSPKLLHNPIKLIWGTKGVIS
jgi:hypothetical protein